MTYLPPEQVVVTYLTGTCGLEDVGVETPDDLLANLPFALVTRVSGTSDYITDAATIQVDTFNPTRAEALATSNSVHLHMLQLRGQAVGGCVIDDVEILMPPAWQDYDDEHVRRYVARYVISTRLGIPLSVVAS